MFVIVAGAGVLGQSVTEWLVRQKHDVVVVDSNRKACDEIYAKTGAVTVHGSATDLEMLEEAGARKADMVLSLLHTDPDNIACSLLARSLGVPRIIARMRDTKYEAAYREAGVSNIVRITDLLRNQIMVLVEHGKIQELMIMKGGGVAIFSVAIPENSWCTGKAVKDIVQHTRFPAQCIFVGFQRGKDGQFTIPRGDHVVHGGDTALLVAGTQDIEVASQLLTGTG